MTQSLSRTQKLVERHTESLEKTESELRCVRQAHGKLQQQMDSLQQQYDTSKQSWTAEKQNLDGQITVLLEEVKTMSYEEAHLATRLQIS